jgi:hypothetical protein
MTEQNDFFVNSLTEYEKALTRKDYSDAKQHLLTSLQNSPSPILNSFYSQKLEELDSLLANEAVKAMPRGFWAKFKYAINTDEKQRRLLKS